MAFDSPFNLAHHLVRIIQIGLFYGGSVTEQSFSKTVVVLLNSLILTSASQVVQRARLKLHLATGSHLAERLL